MCNSYRIKPKRGADTNIDDRIADAAVRLKSDPVRKSAPGIVMRVDGRVPALLRSEEMPEFLAGTGHWNFKPFSGPLAVMIIDPLVRGRPNPRHRVSQ